MNTETPLIVPPWQVAQKEKAKFIQGLARELALLLGGTYVEPKQDGSAGPDTRGTIRLAADAGRLSISQDSHTLRLNISGGWPQDKTGETHVPYLRDGQKHASITVDADKSIAKIAQDITRRLLPVYLPLYAGQLSKAKAADDYRETTYRNIADLALVFGAQPPAPSRTRNQELYRPGGWPVDITVNGSFADFKLNSLPIADAKRLAYFITEFLSKSN